MSLALYRRYRPGTFAEVVGQEHVTEPLAQALRNERVHHAYLFSGPRGCGKTTSARILARCLNCEKGPTAEPCGECRSCQDLAPNGPGSVDVIEIDAASHGGVDDARDLRERAFFAPAASRYKVYIVDEAHMVTSAGFNALLKVVEEPPEHLKFVFATTEPDKVIGTIRSRTHHYPFRLVPPAVLRGYLGEICEREGVPVEPSVLPLVVRAGAGSVRDALSVLDQLLAGAGTDGVTYAQATSLLGFTDARLLDEVVDAMTAQDGGVLFEAVDRVVEGGHDPRRFATDLLERLRDLVILSAVPDAPDKGLVEGPPDQVERLRSQAARFGTAELTRAADIVNGGLTEMRGATAPRLLLELMCARVLLPGADPSEQALLARLDRLERRLAVEGRPTSAEPTAGPSQPPPATTEPARATERPPRERPASKPQSRSSGGLATTSAANGGGTGADTGGADTGAADATDTGASTSAAGAAPDAAAGEQRLDAAALRRAWPDVLDAVKGRRRYTWMMLLDNAHVVAVEGRTLTIAFSGEGARRAFASGGNDEVLRQALIDTLGVDWRIESVLDPSQRGGAAGRERGGPGPTARQSGPGRGSGGAPQTGGEAVAGDPPPGSARGGGASVPRPDESDDPDYPDTGPAGGAPEASAASPPSVSELLERELGAQVIGEYDER